MKKLFLLLLGICFLKSGTGKMILPDSASGRLKVIPFPNLGYSPETRWFFGAVALFNYRIYDDPGTSNTTFKTEFNYTQNRQIIFSADYNLYLLKNKFYITGENSFSKYPESFWGIGNSTPGENEEKYQANRLELNNAFLNELFKYIYLGPRLRLQSISRMETGDAPLLSSGSIEGSEGGIAFGAGYTFLVDTRDNILNATRGAYLSFTNLLFSRALGSDFSFLRIELDLRKYYILKNQHVIAWQWYNIANSGAPPFRMMSLLGSDSHMRGYYQGRFRDRSYTALQVEYRLKLYKAIGMTAFAGTGQVADKISKFSTGGFKPSYGGGLRIRVDKENNVNLRFDYALGNNTEGFYVVFAEAF